MFGRDRQLRPIQGLFEKYQRTLKAPQKVVVDTFTEVVHDLLGVQIDTADVTYSVSQKTLTVRLSGVLVSELRVHEAEILHHMKGRLGAQNVPKKIL